MIKFYSKFLLRYLNKNFLNDLINILIFSNEKLEIENFIKTLKSELSEDLQIPIDHYRELLDIILEINNSKSENVFITYDNFLNYFNSNNRFILSIFENVIKNKIDDVITFNNLYVKLINDIELFFQVQNIKTILYKLDLIKDDENPIKWLKLFKEAIKDANNLFNNTDKNNNCLVFNDENSIKVSVNSILEFIKNSYRSYKTGYDIFDYNISGIESSTVTIISGPSNHAKSIFMINIFKSFLELNDDDGVYILITLEDDINKLFRRIISIFGNYDNNLIKQIFNISSDLLQKNKNYYNKINSIIEEITFNSIINITKSKKTIVLKHSSENTFSMKDVIKIIDEYENKGQKVKAVFIDYIDVMNSSNNIQDEYIAQGEIIKEMRIVARKYCLPIITITQNNRFSENFNQELSNNSIGDSIKKIRYADYVIMIRQRPDVDLFSNEYNVNAISDYIENLIPFEVKITKAKDGNKNVNKYHIFNTINLKIYQSIKDLINDIKICKRKSDILRDKISEISNSEIIVEYKEDGFFENII